MTLASFSVCKQSWACFAELIKVLGINQVLNTKNHNSFHPSKLPKHYAEELDLLQEYEQLVAWFESNEAGTTTMTLEQVLSMIT